MNQAFHTDEFTHHLPAILIAENAQVKSLAKSRAKAIWLASAVLCVISATVVLSSLRVLEVHGTSMTPLILEGDNVLIFRRLKSFSRGSIIALRSPSGGPEMLLRRIVALPGDVLEIRKGRVFINGVYVEEEYISAPQNLRERELAPIQIADHTYFVMADNRDGAYDSRDWGVIRDDQVYGNVLLEY